MKGNRIWIELDKMKDPAHGRKQCELANAMLLKLAQPEDGAKAFRKFSVHETKRGPVYVYGDNAGFTENPDRGEWFNLDYLAKPVASTFPFTVEELNLMIEALSEGEGVLDHSEATQLRHRIENIRDEQMQPKKP